jgi:hypothetical protein
MIREDGVVSIVIQSDWQTFLSDEDVGEVKNLLQSFDISRSSLRDGSL